jgi:hypothetical protein
VKKLTVFIVATLLAAPAVALAGVQVPFRDQPPIEKDEHGSYTETQRDHHKRRTRSIEEKTGAGYCGGTYHSESTGCHQGSTSTSKKAKDSKKKKPSNK